MIVDSDALAAYNKVLRFLMKVKRAKSALEACTAATWHIQRRRQKPKEPRHRQQGQRQAQGPGSGSALLASAAEEQQKEQEEEAMRRVQAQARARAWGAMQRVEALLRTKLLRF
eukprot:jgi/Mesen1/8436/ME000475S07716